MKSVGIDLGTTTISLNVVDSSELEVWQKETLSNGSFQKTPNFWERIQDADLIVEKARAVLEKLLEEWGDICSIGLTGQMHGIVYVDQDGKAVSPLYTWQDGRGDLPIFEGKSLCDLLREDHGINAASGYGVVTHLYNLKMGLVPTKAVTFCTIADYLGMALTGRKRPLLHVSQGASLGLFDGESQKFREDVALEWGMDLSFFPEITQDLRVLGSFHGIPVCVSLGDNQASFLGSVRQAPETILVNVGTGGQISTFSKERFEAPGIEARPFLKGSFLLVGATLCGGDAYAALESFFREYAVAAGAPDVPQYPVMKNFLEGQGDSKQSWQVRTTFAGTREKPQGSGSIRGIRRENFHPASMIRGVLEGIAEELYELYRKMREEPGMSRSMLVASGNGVRQNPILRQILEERFQMPLQVLANEEEAAFGAAISALGTIGQLSLSWWLGL